MTTIVWVLVAGVAGFVLGMLIEFFVNSTTLRDTKEELLSMRRENILLKRQIKSNVEIIEITDNNLKNEHLFDPW